MKKKNLRMQRTHAAKLAQDQWLHIGVYGGLWIQMFCLVICVVSATLVTTGAAPPAESYVLQILHANRSYLSFVGLVAGLIIVFASLYKALQEHRRDQRLWSGLLVVCSFFALIASHTFLRGLMEDSSQTIPVAGSWHTTLSLLALALVCALWAIRFWQRQRSLPGSTERTTPRETSQRAEMCWHSLLACFPGMLLSAGLATAGIGVFLAWWTTHATASQGGLGALLLSGAGAFMYALLPGAMLCGFVALFMVLTRTRWFAPRPHMVAGSLASLFVFSFGLWGLGWAFGDECLALNLSALVVVMILVAGLLYGVAFSYHLLLPRSIRNRVADVGALVRASCLTALLLPLLPFLKRSRRRLRPSSRLLTIGYMSACVYFFLLVAALFPNVKDYGDRIQVFVVALIVLLVVLVSQLAHQYFERNWALSLFLLSMCVVSSLIIIRFSETWIPSARSQVFRHNPFGKYTLNVVESLVLKEHKLSPGQHPAPRITQPTTKPTNTAPASRSPQFYHQVMQRLRRKKPLTIVVILDAARPDRMGVYGYKRQTPPFVSTTPQLDRYKHHFLRFTHAFSQSTATTCSLRHLFTGRYSSRYMLKKKGIAPFWTNELMQAGYHTFFLNIIGNDFNGISRKAFLRNMPAEQRKHVRLVSCPYCSKPAHVKASTSPGHQAHHRHAQATHTPQGHHHHRKTARFIQCTQQSEYKTVRELLHMLKSHTHNKASGVFAFLHMDATHTPWQRISWVKGTRDFGKGEANLYDHNIHYSDLLLGRLIRGLQRLGLWRETLLVVTSDHGTGLKEHGQYGGFHPWLQHIHIPLLMKIPGIPGREIHSLTGLFDIGPTLMQVFAPEALSRLEGQSLWPILANPQRKQAGNRILFGLSAFEDCYYLIHENGDHYIYHRAERYEQLYNWRKDPKETHDLTHDTRKLARYRSYMHWFLYNHGKDRSYTHPHHFRKADK